MRNPAGILAFIESALNLRENACRCLLPQTDLAESAAAALQKHCSAEAAV